MKRIVHFLKSQKAFIIIFLLCFSYWGYLFVNSQMEIKYDAVDYEYLGTVIYQHGWGQFFKQGPNREPLYPWLIASSMNIAHGLDIPYQQVQKFLQIIILFITQLMLLALLKKAKIHNAIIGATILYFGFSPAIVNSTFSLYSEIAAYPFVLGMIYFGYLSWRDIHVGTLSKVMWWGILISLSFMGAAFVKAIFQYIFLIYLIPYGYVVLYSLIKKDKGVFVKAFIFIIVSSSMLVSSVISYRFLNKYYNGTFDFTNRYDVNLFGTIAKRVDHLSPQLMMAHLASVPGTGVCRAFFSEENCKYCEFFGMDQYRAAILPELLRNRSITDGEDRKRATLSFAFEKISENPLQYFFLTAIESLKMAFWESTQIGFVLYPHFLKQLFNSMPIKNGIRLLVSLLTYFSLFYIIGQLYRWRSKLRDFKSDEVAGIQIGFFVLLIIVPFTGFYALFPILTRFALPIAALYLFCIAFTAQGLTFGKKLHKKPAQV